MTDCIIIGGGPAGLSAALTLRQRNKSVMVVSSPPEDSPLYRALRVDNYAGLPAISGADLLDVFMQQAENAGAQFYRGRATSVLPMGDSFGVGVGSDYIEGRCVILALGSPLGLSYPGEKELLGRGVSYCATCDGMLYKGRRVAVIGLGFDSEEEADFLRSIGCEVEYFDKNRAKKYRVLGTEKVEALEADGVEYPVEAVFILRPAIAAEALVPGLTFIDGRIEHDEKMATAIPGIFACGDCTGVPYQVGKAAGEGNTAAIYASKYIEGLDKK